MDYSNFNEFDMEFLEENYSYVTCHVPIANKTFIRVYYDSGEGDVRIQQDCGGLWIVLIGWVLIMVRFLFWCDMEFVGDVCGDLRSGSTYVVNYSWVCHLDSGWPITFASRSEGFGVSSRRYASMVNCDGIGGYG
ncbi:hypothetical protein MtrunA17_Chr3g0139961 [Medicago truncatula]|uniref:Transmembrane protein n=1 Tax=Medicago truncatula TaxID=3880 RepID=A0A396J1W2_MEDTR|nr:hypothetical protein MtrunA17_Chr3g0139961 [Medicago truncatula]